MVRNFLLLVFLTPLLAFAHEMHLDHAPINPSDNASLQRGAKYFVNYCLNCHSANYMRYNRLTDIGLNDKQILENFVFSEGKVGDLMKVNMNPNASKVWFGVAPPDLSVITRARSSEAGSGADWVYTYLRSFYRDPTRPTGWNNTTYLNFFESLGIKTKLSDYGVGAEIIPKVISRFEQRGIKAFGERGDVTLEDIAKILELQLK